MSNVTDVMKQSQSSSAINNTNSTFQTPQRDRDSNVYTNGQRPSGPLDQTIGANLAKDHNSIYEDPLNVTAGPLGAGRANDTMADAALIDVRATAEFEDGYLKY